MKAAQNFFIVSMRLFFGHKPRRGLFSYSALSSVVWVIQAPRSLPDEQSFGPAGRNLELCMQDRLNPLAKKDYLHLSQSTSHSIEVLMVGVVKHFSPWQLTAWKSMGLNAGSR
jgi:hypothetical protein